MNLDNYIESLQQIRDEVGGHVEVCTLSTSMLAIEATPPSIKNLHRDHRNDRLERFYSEHRNLPEEKGQLVVCVG